MGFRCVEFPDFRLYGCYCSPNCSITDFMDFLLRLERSIRSSHILVVAAGDFNAKSKACGNPIDDTRAALLVELMSALDKPACNDGRSPTFIRGSSESHIDITFTSARIRGNVDNGKVLECESLNLHRFITFDLKPETQIPLSLPLHGWAEDESQQGHPLPGSRSDAEGPYAHPLNRRGCRSTGSLDNRGCRSLRPETPAKCQ